MSSYVNQQLYGDAVLERMSRSPHASKLKKETQNYKAVHGKFTKYCTGVEVAQQRRDDALEGVGDADGQLDQNLLALADVLVGAGLGKRQNPFAAYSSYNPSRLTVLAYSTEEKEVQVLLAALRKKKLDATVTASVKQVAAAADKVAAAVKAFDGPQADYEAAMQDRDALLLDWNKALGRLKRAAAVAYDEDRAGYRALFAPLKKTLLRAPKRARKKAATPAAATPPDTTH